MGSKLEPGMFTLDEMAQRERDRFNALRASRKADRDQIADALGRLVAKRGGTVTERRDEPRNPGYSGAGIVLHMSLNGVGAMIDIDDCHGGEWALIHWFNDHGHAGPVRNFTARFQTLTGGGGNSRPHHKSTSHPRNWYSLAMCLDAGLLLAARGEAFEPVKA